MIGCGGSCKRWFHPECIDWKRDEERNLLIASYDENVTLPLTTQSQESNDDEDFYCIKCWEQKKEKPKRFAELTSNKGDLEEKNERLGFHGKHLNYKQIDNYVNDLRTIVGDDVLLDGLLDSRPRPYPTTQHMTGVSRKTLAIQGRSFEILQLCISVEQCDCCGKVQPFACDSQLKNRRTAFSDPELQKKLGGKDETKDIFHHRHFDGQYRDAFRCTCQEHCNGCQFYALDRPKEKDLYHALHGSKIGKNIVIPFDNKARLCKDCYNDKIYSDGNDNKADPRIARTFAYQNGFGSIEPAPTEEPPRFDPSSTDTSHMNTPAGEAELRYVLGQLTPAEEKAIAPVLPLMKVVRLKHNNIKRKGIVTCVRRDSAVQKILPNLPSECKTIVFEYKANSSGGMKSFRCRRLWIQRALLLLRATKLEVWRDIQIDTEKLQAWPEDGNLLDLQSIHHTNATDAAEDETKEDGDEDVMEMGPAPAQNGDEEEVFVGVTSEARETPAQGLYRANQIVDQETGVARNPQFHVTQKVWYIRNSGKQMARILHIQGNVCRIRLLRQGVSGSNESEQSESERETTLDQLKHDPSIEQDWGSGQPQPLRMDATSATFRQDDVFSRGNIVRKENEKHAWTMAFPTLFPPRLTIKGWAIFGDITAHPQHVLGMKNQTASRKAWAKWMIWRSDGAPSAHSTFGLVIHSVLFRGDLQAQGRVMLSNQEIPNGMTIRDFEEAWKEGDGGDGGDGADGGNGGDGGGGGIADGDGGADSDSEADGGRIVADGGARVVSGSDSRPSRSRRKRKNPSRKTRKQLQSAISYWTENVRGTDQYWGAERRKFMATALYHSYTSYG